MKPQKTSQEKIDNYRQIILNNIKHELEESLSPIGKINSKIIEFSDFKMGFDEENKSTSKPLNLHYKLRFYHIEKWLLKTILLEVHINFNVSEERITEVKVVTYNKDALNLVNTQLTNFKRKYEKFLTSCKFSIIEKFEEK